MKQNQGKYLVNEKLLLTTKIFYSILLFDENLKVTSRWFVADWNERSSPDNTVSLGLIHDSTVILLILFGFHLPVVTRYLFELKYIPWLWTYTGSYEDWLFRRAILKAFGLESGIVAVYNGWAKSQLKERLEIK